MIEIYGKEGCPHCTMSKLLLDGKNMPYDYYTMGVDFDKDKFNELFPLERSLPQIVVDGRHIGGYFALLKLVKEKL